jgi:hypothetical protein
VRSTVPLVTALVLLAVAGALVSIRAWVLLYRELNRRNTTPRPANEEDPGSSGADAPAEPERNPRVDSGRTPLLRNPRRSDQGELP